MVKIKAGKVGEYYIPQFEIKAEPSREIKNIGKTKKLMTASKIFYQEFWESFLDLANKKTTFFSNISPSRRGYIYVGAGITGVKYSPYISSKIRSVELYIDRKNKEETKLIFDKLYENKDMIEAKFGGKLEWQKIEGRKASRIRVEFDLLDWQKRENWEAIQDPMIDAIVRLRDSLDDYLKKIKI